MRSTTITRDRARPPIPHDVARIDPYAMAQLLGNEIPTTRLPVTDRTLLGLPAANAAIQKIANAAAQMLRGSDVYNGSKLVTPRPIVVQRPNMNYRPYEFYKEVVSTALMRGNWVGLPVDPDENGFPQQVVPIPVEAVNCYVSESGHVVYEISGEHYTPDQVVHVRIGVTQPGNPWAIGVIEAFRRGLGAQLDQQGMAQDVWRQGAVPSGIVTLDVDTPTLEQATAVKTQWVGQFGGQRTVGVLGKRMSYQPVTWSANDAQFIESRQFSVAEMALMFGLRPEDLGATVGGSNLTYGNRTDDALQRITDAYMPVVIPVEETWGDLLPDGWTVKANAEALLRSSTKERYEIHALAQSIGLQTKNETREIEGREAIKEEEVQNDAA